MQKRLLVLSSHDFMLVAWLAASTGRTVSEQVRAIVRCHAVATAEQKIGRPMHTWHCQAAVRLFPWPRFHVYARPVTVCVILSEPNLAHLAASSRRAVRSVPEQLAAIVLSYLRTLRDRSSVLRGRAEARAPLALGPLRDHDLEL